MLIFGRGAVTVHFCEILALSYTPGAATIGGGTIFKLSRGPNF